ncbi:MAG: hypothetical protein ACREYF_00380 [Gammaproteobacteria bacterium]
MIIPFLGLGKTTPKSLETTGPLELPIAAEVIAILETLAKGEKISAQDIQKAIKKKFKKKYAGKKLILRHLLDLLARLAHDEKIPDNEKILSLWEGPKEFFALPGKYE